VACCILRNVVPRVRPPVCCVKHGSSDRLAACIEIARNDFTQEIAEKAEIGDFRMKSCPNEAFSGVLVVTFRRAAAATPTSKGVTSVLSSKEATALLSGMDVSTVVGLRDRAIIAVMTYTFARVGVVVSLNVEDYYSQKNVGGCACTRRTASSTKCPAITSWNLFSTPI
jgi:hypothetical protein